MAVRHGIQGGLAMGVLGGSVTCRRALVLAAMALGVAGAFATILGSPSRAAGPTSVFYYESASDNGLGQGTADLITSDEMPFVASGGGMVSIGQAWHISAAGPGGARLVAGTTYTGARDPGDPTAPWLDLSSQSLYGNCWGIDGGFTVHDVGYYGSAFSRLSMSFTATCGGTGGTGGIIHGELRFDTSAPAFEGIAFDPVVRNPVDLGFATIGQAGDPLTITLRNAGSVSVGVGPASLSGADAASFEIVDDACPDPGQLAAGASCTFDVRLSPVVSGSLQAEVIVPTDTPVTSRRLSVKGAGQTPTATTIDGPTGWQWPPIQLSAQVSPSPTSTDGGSSVWFQFPDAGPGGPWGGPEPMMADGTADYGGYMPPGVHRVYAEFNPSGTGTWARSQSETITVKVMRQSSISLTTSDASTLATEPPTIVASLQPADVVYTGGQLTLTDTTTGTVLGSVDVGPGRQQLIAEPFLTGGTHLLRAEYTGYEGVAGSSAQRTQTILMEAGATVNGGKFYPEPDGYRDTLTVEAWREHPLMVVISVEAKDTSQIVRTAEYPPETDWIEWEWDGRDDAGTLVAAGQYRVRVSFHDGGDTPKVVTDTVSVSRERVSWKTRSVTLKGRSYSLSGKSRDASISRTRSSWSGGVRLSSGKGSASVSYAFPVATADVYGKITFSARGRSTNGHKGLIAIWNPDAGSYRYPANYDAARLIGPGYTWWKTAVPIDADRVRNGKVRALVAVAKDMGKSGPATFDVRDVRLTYQVGTLVAPAGEPIAAESADEPTPPSSARVAGRATTDLLGGRTLPELHRVSGSRTSPSEDAAPRGTSSPAAGESSVFAFESQRGDAGVLTSSDYTFDADTDWYSPIAALEVSDGQNTLLFAAQGPDGALLQAGRTYEDALDYSLAGRPFFKLDSWGSCNGGFDRVADFTVHDVAYDAGGRFERLSLSFSMASTSGEIRFNTAAPSFSAIHQTPFCDPAASSFPDTHVGDTTGPVTRTLTNAGTAAVSFGQAGLVGDARADFDIVSDTCSNVTLASGASCTLATTFSPTRLGSRGATLGIAMDYGSGARMIGLHGYGKAATTTSLTVPAGTAWSPVTLEASVSPNPYFGPNVGIMIRFEFPDDPSLNAEVRLQEDGTASAVVSLPPGAHRVHARFYGFDDYEPSQSDTVTLQVAGSFGTSIELTTSKAYIVATERPTITARLLPDGVSGGELRLYDGLTVLGSLDVSPGDQELTVTPLLDGLGSHDIYASFSGHQQYPKASATVEIWVSADTEVLGSLKVDPAVFYPVVDDFRDQTIITTRRNERLSVEAAISADEGGAVVYEASAPVGTSDVTFDWDGRIPGGALAPAGYYTLRATLTDDAANTKVLQRRIVLSHDWVEWSTSTVVRDGRQYSLVGKSKDAVISKTQSAYARGVKLNSKQGSATVGYAFPVADSRLYRGVTFEVMGKSPNGHQAVISIWNPTLGGYRDLSHYDAAATAGPGYAAWGTSATDPHRVNGGVARAVVSTWNGLGGAGSATFDIRRVTLAYEIGTVQRVTTWTTSAIAAEADLVADYLADARDGRAGRTVRGLGGWRVTRWLHERVARQRAVEPGQVELAITDPDVESVVPTPEATEQPEPTEQPELTREPQPTPEVTGSPGQPDLPPSLEPTPETKPAPTAEPPKSEPTPGPKVEPTPEPTPALSEPGSTPQPANAE